MARNPYADAPVTDPRKDFSSSVDTYSRNVRQAEAQANRITASIEAERAKEKRESARAAAQSMTARNKLTKTAAKAGGYDDYLYEGEGGELKSGLTDEQNTHLTETRKKEADENIRQLEAKANVAYQAGVKSRLKESMLSPSKREALGEKLAQYESEHAANEQLAAAGGEKFDEKKYKEDEEKLRLGRDALREQVSLHDNNSAKFEEADKEWNASKNANRYPAGFEMPEAVPEDPKERVEFIDSYNKRQFRFNESTKARNVSTQSNLQSRLERDTGIRSSFEEWRKKGGTPDQIAEATKSRDNALSKSHIQYIQQNYDDNVRFDEVMDVEKESLALLRPFINDVIGTHNEEYAKEIKKAKKEFTDNIFSAAETFKDYAPKTHKKAMVFRDKVKNGDYTPEEVVKGYKELHQEFGIEAKKMDAGSDEIYDTLIRNTGEGAKDVYANGDKLEKINGKWIVEAYAGGKTIDKNRHDYNVPGKMWDAMGNIGDITRQGVVAGLRQFGATGTAEFLHQMQDKGGYSDEDMIRMYSDFQLKHGDYDDNEESRVLSNGRILINPALNTANKDYYKRLINETNAPHYEKQRRTTPAALEQHQANVVAMNLPRIRRASEANDNMPSYDEWENMRIEESKTSGETFENEHLTPEQQNQPWANTWIGRTAGAKYNEFIEKYNTEGEGQISFSDGDDFWKRAGYSSHLGLNKASSMIWGGISIISDNPYVRDTNEFIVRKGNKKRESRDINTDSGGFGTWVTDVILEEAQSMAITIGGGMAGGLGVKALAAKGAFKRFATKEVISKMIPKISFRTSAGLGAIQSAGITYGQYYTEAIDKAEELKGSELTREEKDEIGNSENVRGRAMVAGAITGSVMLSFGMTGIDRIFKSGSVIRGATFKDFLKNSTNKAMSTSQRMVLLRKGIIDVLRPMAHEGTEEMTDQFLQEFTLNGASFEQALERSWEAFKVGAVLGGVGSIRSFTSTGVNVKNLSDPNMAGEALTQAFGKKGTFSKEQIEAGFLLVNNTPSKGSTNPDVVAKNLKTAIETQSAITIQKNDANADIKLGQKTNDEQMTNDGMQAVQDANRNIGIIKIANGANLESLPKAEREAVKADLADGSAGFDMVGGEVVITDTAINQLARDFPDAADGLVPMNETQQRAKINEVLEKDKADAEAVNEETGGDIPATKVKKAEAKPTETKSTEKPKTIRNTFNNNEVFSTKKSANIYNKDNKHIKTHKVTPVEGGGFELTPRTPKKTAPTGGKPAKKKTAPTGKFKVAISQEGGKVRFVVVKANSQKEAGNKAITDHIPDKSNETVNFNSIEKIGSQPTPKAETPKETAEEKTTPKSETPTKKDDSSKLNHKFSDPKSQKKWDTVKAEIEDASNLFPNGVKIVDSNQTDAPASYIDGTLQINPKTLIDSMMIGSDVSGKKWLKATLNEELIHFVAGEVITNEQVTSIWNNLTDEIKTKVTEVYYANNPKNKEQGLTPYSGGHEVIRMVVQKDKSILGYLTEEAGVEHSGRLLLKELIKVFKDISNYISNLTKANAELKSTADLVIKSLNEIQISNKQKSKNTDKIGKPETKKEPLSNKGEVELTEDTEFFDKTQNLYKVLESKVGNDKDGYQAVGDRAFTNNKGVVDTESKKELESTFAEWAGIPASEVEFIRNGISMVFRNTRTGDFMKVTQDASDVQIDNALMERVGTTPFITDTNVTSMKYEGKVALVLQLQSPTAVEASDVGNVPKELMQEVMDGNPVLKEQIIETDNGGKNFGLEIRDGKVYGVAFDLGGLENVTDSQIEAIQNTEPVGVDLNKFSELVQKNIINGQVKKLNTTPKAKAESESDKINKPDKPVEKDISYIPKETLEKIKQYPDFHENVINDFLLDSADVSRYLSSRSLSKTKRDKVRKKFSNAKVSQIESFIEELSSESKLKLKLKNDLKKALTRRGESDELDKKINHYELALSLLKSARINSKNPQSGAKFETRLLAKKISEAQIDVKKREGELIAKSASTPNKQNNTPKAKTPSKKDDTDNEAGEIPFQDDNASKPTKAKPAPVKTEAVVDNQEALEGMFTDVVEENITDDFRINDDGSLTLKTGMGKAETQMAIAEALATQASNKSITDSEAETIWASMPTQLQKIVAIRFRKMSGSLEMTPLSATRFMLTNLVSEKIFSATLKKHIRGGDRKFIKPLLEFFRKFVSNIRMLIKKSPDSVKQNLKMYEDFAMAMIKESVTPQALDNLGIALPATRVTKMSDATLPKGIRPMKNDVYEITLPDGSKELTRSLEEAINLNATKFEGEMRKNMLSASAESIIAESQTPKQVDASIDLVVALVKAVAAKSGYSAESIFAAIDVSQLSQSSGDLSAFVTDLRNNLDEKGRAVHADAIKFANIKLGAEVSDTASQESVTGSTSSVARKMRQMISNEGMFRKLLKNTKNKIYFGLLLDANTSLIEKAANATEKAKASEATPLLKTRSELITEIQGITLQDYLTKQDPDQKAKLTEEQQNDWANAEMKKVVDNIYNKMDAIDTKIAEIYDDVASDMKARRGDKSVNALQMGAGGKTKANIAKQTVQFSRKANATSPAHEFIHVIETMKNPTTGRSLLADALGQSGMDSLQGWIKDGVEKGGNRKELLAEAMEKYLRRGVAPNNIRASVDILSEGAAQYYNSTAGETAGSMQYNDSVKGVLDELFNTERTASTRETAFYAKRWRATNKLDGDGKTVLRDGVVIPPTVNGNKQKGVSERIAKAIRTSLVPKHGGIYVQEFDGKFYAVYEQPAVPFNVKNEGDQMNFQSDANNNEAKLYSKLATTLDQKIQGKKAAVNQIKGLINKAGLKPEEVKWSGVMEWLDSQESKSILKSDIMNYLKGEGSVVFEEVSSGRSINQNDENLLSELEDRDSNEIPESSGFEPKYEEYSSEGGTNYREVVLTKPETPPTLNTFDIEKAKKLINEGVNVVGVSGGIGVQKVSIAEINDFSKFATLEDSMNQNYIIEEKEGSSEYTSSHFRSPNYVAHMRLKDKSSSIGEGTLIEEIQSDRHQDGRKKGYTGSETNPTDAEIIEYFGLSDNANPADYKAEMIETLANQRFDDRVPDAPYRKDWGVQMFKRALLEAVNSGKKWIGWSEGEVHNERYNLELGGEGMKGFYDVMLPKAVQKLIKPMGGKVEKNTNMTVNNDSGWMVEITPELERSVRGGVPLFQSDIPATQPSNLRTRVKDSLNPEQTPNFQTDPSDSPAGRAAASRMNVTNEEFEQLIADKDERNPDGTKVVPSNPKRANISGDQSVRNFNDISIEIYNKSATPETIAEWNADADLLMQDVDWMKQTMFEFANGTSTVQPTPAFIIAATRVTANETQAAMASGDRDAVVRASVLGFTQTEGRATFARIMRAMQDPFQSPQQRAAYSLGIFIQTPSNEMVRALKDKHGAKNDKDGGTSSGYGKVPPENREAYYKELAEFQGKRYDKAKKQLEKDGYDIAEVFNSKNEGLAVDTQADTDALKGLTEKQQALVKMWREGKSPQEIKDVLGVSGGSQDKVLAKFNVEAKKQARKLAEQGFRVDTMEDYRAGRQPSKMPENPTEAELDKAVADIVETSFRGGKNRAKTFNILDPRDVMGVARSLEKLDEDFLTKAVGTWYANVFSLKTWAANALSIPFAGYKMLFERLPEVVMNEFLKNPDSARVEEYKYLAIGMKEWLPRAAQQALIAYDVERAHFQKFIDGGDAADQISGDTSEDTRGYQMGHVLDYVDEALSSALKSKLAQKTGIPRLIRNNFIGNKFIGDKGLKRPTILGIFGGKKKSTELKLGKSARAILRFNMGVDDFVRYTVGGMEVTALALREGRKQGLKGQDLKDFIKIETHTEGSDSWKAAGTKATESVFMDRAPDMFSAAKRASKDGDVLALVADFASAVASLADKGLKDLDKYAKAHSEVSGLGGKFGFQSARILGSGLRVGLIPFNNVIMSIFRAALIRVPNPLVALIAAAKVARYAAMNRGNPDEDAAHAITKLSEQIVAFAMGAMVLSWGEGDDDDDEKFILISGNDDQGGEGSQAKNSLARGKGMGGLRIRVGEKTFDYSNIDPLATSLSTTVDLGRNLKNLIKGKVDVGDVIQDLAANTIYGALKNKTMFSSLNDAIMIANERKSGNSVVARNIATFIIPNLFRQPIKDSNKYRDQTGLDEKGKAGLARMILYEVIPSADDNAIMSKNPNAPTAKRGQFGEKVERGKYFQKKVPVVGHMLDWMLDPQDAKVVPEDQRSDKYNQEFPFSTQAPIGGKPSKKFRFDDLTIGKSVEIDMSRKQFDFINERYASHYNRITEVQVLKSVKNDAANKALAKKLAKDDAKGEGWFMKEARARHAKQQSENKNK